MLHQFAVIASKIIRDYSCLKVVPLLLLGSVDKHRSTKFEFRDCTVSVCCHCVDNNSSLQLFETSSSVFLSGLVDKQRFTGLQLF